MSDTNPQIDLDSERAALGGIFLSPETLTDVAAMLTPEDFSRDAHGLVFRAMLTLQSKGEPIDYLTVVGALKSTGDLDRAGGLALIAGLDASVPASANLTAYANKVRDASLRRRLVQTCMQIVNEARDATAPIADTIGRAEEAIHKAADAGSSRVTLVPIRAAVVREFAALEKLYERQTDVTGLETGLRDLDLMTTGLQNGDLVILGGRPSMGKTACAMGIATHVAVSTSRPVLVFEQEMSEGSLVRRIFSSEGRVDGTRLRTGKFIDSDWPRLARAAEMAAKTNLIVDDSAGVTLMEIRARARRIRQKHGPIALVMVDYIGLLRAAEPSQPREQQVADFTRGLKALARELKCPVLALSQLNRELEKRADKRPTMSDLRESGAIEQDADVVIFAYRDEVYNAKSEDAGIAELIIAKQRNGPIGTVRVAFQKDYARFDNLAENGGRSWTA